MKQKVKSQRSFLRWFHSLLWVFVVSLPAVVKNVEARFCPVGYICDQIDGYIVNPRNDSRTLCTDIQNQVRSAGYGNILDGIWCPAGGYQNASLWNCPAGFYCEDPGRAPKVCPEGYYCPAKTLNYKDFKCSGCGEGAKKYSPSVVNMALTLVLTILVPLLVFGALRLKENKDDVGVPVTLRQSDHEDLQNLKPILAKINERLGGKFFGSTDVLELNARGELIGYNAQLLFDAIDKDKNGVLSLDELGKVLDLSGIKLLMFIKMMKEASGFSSRSEKSEVSRIVFVTSFLDTMKIVAKFDPTLDEVNSLFDELAETGEISLEDLQNSILAQFLTDKEILRMQRIFVQKIKEANAMDSSMRLRGSSKTMRFGGNSKTMRLVGSSKSTRKITKEDFLAWYASALNTVATTEEVQLEPCDIHFQNLSLHVRVNKEEKPIVDNVTGRVQSGTMTALMGGSGAGKTSLLNALCGRAYYGTVSGEIAINGQKAQIEDFTDAMGFVPQDDIVFSELTVKENLVFAGRFKLPKGTPLTYIEMLADEVIADLGLTRVADSRVGDVRRRGVSGGEKKRVNIGLELMAKPSILFLDEPTSGLDSSSAMVVIQSLKKLVLNQGMTVCSVIHQPRKSIFELFDSLILLGVGGKTVYNGPTDAVLMYFTGQNYELPEGESLADWVIDISSGELSPVEIQSNMIKQSNVKGSILGGSMNAQESSKAEMKSANRERLYENWNSHFENLDPEDCHIYNKPEKTALPSTRDRPGFLSQTWYQFLRCTILFRRNFFSEMQDALLVVGGTFAIILLDGSLKLTPSTHRNPDIPNEYSFLTSVGTSPKANERFEEFLPLVFSHSIRGFMNYLNFATKASVVICVLTALGSTKALTEKRVEFFREAGSGYSVNAYYLAVNIFDALKVSAKMMVAAFYTLAFRNTASSIGAMVLQFVLLGWIAGSWGLVFPLFVPPSNVVMSTGFFAIFTSLLLSGAPSTPIEYELIYKNPFVNALSSFIAPPRFFVESLAINEFKGMPEQHGFTILFDGNFTNGFNHMGVGGNDHVIHVQSSNGWYWGVVPSIFVGLTIRTLGFILIHSCSRAQRLQQSLWKDLRDDKMTRLGAFFFTFLFFGFAAIAAFFFLS